MIEPTKEDFDDWYSHPVTISLKEHIEDKLSSLTLKLPASFAGKPDYETAVRDYYKLQGYMMSYTEIIKNLTKEENGNDQKEEDKNEE